MTQSESRITLMLALDPSYWRAHDKADWVIRLVGAVDAAAPDIFHVERYEMRDMIVYVQLRANHPAARVRKLLRDDDAIMRLRGRLADLGARPEFEIERD